MIRKPETLVLHAGWRRAAAVIAGQAACALGVPPGVDIVRRHG